MPNAPLQVHQDFNRQSALNLSYMQVPLQDVLNSSGLSAMFPKVMERLELSCNTSINSDSDGDALEKLTPFKDYLQHMAHLQQVN